MRARAAFISLTLWAAHAISHFWHAVHLATSTTKIMSGIGYLNGNPATLVACCMVWSRLQRSQSW